MDKPGGKTSMSDKGAPSEHVGQLLKQLREERGISMREVSRRSGLSANAMSMIERGLTSPSVSTLYRLTDALNVPITALFRQDHAQEAIVFRPVSDRTQIPFPSASGKALEEDFIGRMQPFMLTLEGVREKIVHQQGS
jgi:transcriptional regulator with XRE-family HTH domain